MADSNLNVGLCVGPVFTYKKGQLWIQDQGLTKALAQVGNLNVDRTFSILSKDKTDLCGQRPMVYPGRLLAQAGNDGTERWKRSRLLQDRCK